MTITSVGYQGQIMTDAEWGDVATHGAEYGVRGAGDFAVTQVATVERTVRVAPGRAWGKGVRDVSDSPITVLLNPLTSGSRWDTVVLRRNRAATPRGVTTVQALVGSTTEAIAAGRTSFSAGQSDDQPIALVKVEAQSGTSGVVKEIRDLRCWAHNSGLIAKSTLVHGYLDRPATKVRIDGFEWSLEFDRDDTLRWVRTGGGRLLAVTPGVFWDLPPSGLLGAGVQVWGNDVQVIASVPIEDPRVPYRVGIEAVGFWGSEVNNDGSRWDLDFMVGGTVIDTYIGMGFYGNWRKWSVGPSGQVFTGRQDVTLRARKIYGPSGYGAVLVAHRGLAARVWQQ